MVPENVEAALEIVTYPHPTLRRVSKPLRRVDAALRRQIREMFDLMYAAKGIGLAANQVNIPLRLFIVNLEARPDAGEEMVFLNPVLSLPRGGTEEAEEGCLSLPGVYGPVTRPRKVRISAYTLRGEECQMDVSGMLARCIQHEVDHLDGILFPDRMSETARAAIRAELEVFESDFRSRQRSGSLPSDAQIAQQWAEWESRYA